MIPSTLALKSTPGLLACDIHPSTLIRLLLTWQGQLETARRFLNPTRVSNALPPSFLDGYPCCKAFMLASPWSKQHNHKSRLMLSTSHPLPGAFTGCPKAAVAGLSTSNAKTTNKKENSSDLRYLEIVHLHCTSFLVPFGKEGIKPCTEVGSGSWLRPCTEAAKERKLELTIASGCGNSFSGN